MKIPITKYGLPQVAIYPLITVVIMGAVGICGRKILPGVFLWAIEFILAAILIWILSFFRDPPRNIPQDKDILVSPADGTIADVNTVEHPFIGGEAVRIGI